MRSAGACWTSQAPIGPRSTLQYPTRLRSRTPSTSWGWPTPRSTRSAAAFRTRPWAIAAANTTRCIGPASCWCRRLRTSPTPDESGCGACSMPATPTARSATPGTPKRPCARSMTSTTPKWAPRPSPARLRPPGPRPASGDQPAGPHHLALAHPDLQLAHREGHQRSHRGRQQPRQTGQTRRVRVHQLRELPDPGSAVRRQTQLGTARHPHPDLKREEPLIGGSGRMLDLQSRIPVTIIGPYCQYLHIAIRIVGCILHESTHNSADMFELGPLLASVARSI